ncbi:MAG: transporter substrate-binding domain-containing protein [Burkholderiaceae bacterium]|nr:transporter substrate-binding domain-containing protein [Roseateles sp.]MBV8469379.1 transporter substrate-binding domain-containing protein [Burkholderiaceae bacterium]
MPIARAGAAESGAAAVSGTRPSAALPALTAYTEEWPPYNYLAHGQVTGISTEVLKAVCVEAGVVCGFELVPWVRAYKSAQHTANTLVYTTARRADREHDFIWIGPVLPRSTWVFLRDDLAAADRRNRDLSGLRFAVVRGEAAEADLLAAGVAEKNLAVEASNDSALRMVLHGYADAVVDTELGMRWNLKQMHVAPERLVPLFKLSEEGAYYFALNKQSDPRLAEQLQAALERLRKAGLIDKLSREFQAARP